MAHAQRLQALTHWLVFGAIVTLLWIVVPVQALANAPPPASCAGPTSA